MTHCTSGKINFSRIFGRSLIGDLKGGTITSDAGGLLLREADKALGLTKALAAGIRDRRDPKKIEHSICHEPPYIEQYEVGLIEHSMCRLC